MNGLTELKREGQRDKQKKKPERGTERQTNSETDRHREREEDRGTETHTVIAYTDRDRTLNVFFSRFYSVNDSNKQLLQDI